MEMQMTVRIISVFVLLMTLCQGIMAETYIREYTHKASDADSKISSRTIAINQVKTLLLQEIGTYIHHQISISKDSLGSVYSHEDIQAITAGVTQVNILDEQWDGKSYYLKAQIDVDRSEIIKAIYKLQGSEEKQLELIRENQTLRRQIEQEIGTLDTKVRAGNNLESNIPKYTASINSLSDADTYEAAWILDINGHYFDAAQLYERAAKQGHVISQTRLGFMYMIGKGVRQNDSLAKKWITAAVKQGYPLAKNYLGDLYSQGIGVRYDLNAAVYWYKEAANNGVKEAMVNLYVYYSSGDGGQQPRNTRVAEYWKMRASEAE